MALWASTRATRQLQPATACSAACRVPARLVVESSLCHLPHSPLTAPLTLRTVSRNTRFLDDPARKGYDTITTVSEGCEGCYARAGVARW